MTPLDLVDSLKTYLEGETRNLFLPVRVDRRSGKKNERPPEVFTMRLPDKDAETKRIPYLLVQYIKSKFSQEEGKPPEHSCMVRIVAATYSENGEEGARCVLNLLTRVLIAFIRDGMIADRYILKSAVEMIVYPDSTPPYYLGEMITEWTMPPLYTLSPLDGTELAGHNPITESEVMDKW